MYHVKWVDPRELRPTLRTRPSAFNMACLHNSFIQRQRRVESGSSSATQRMVRSASRIAAFTRQLLNSSAYASKLIRGSLQRRYSFHSKHCELTSLVVVLLHCVLGPHSRNEGSCYPFPLHEWSCRWTNRTKSYFPFLISYWILLICIHSGVSFFFFRSLLCLSNHPFQ